MLRNQERRVGWARTAPIVLLSMAAVAVAFGLSFHLGVFSGSTPAAADEILLVSVSSDRLDFGVVPINGAVVRQLVLRNDGEDPVRARLLVAGGAYVVQPDNLTLHPGISSRVSVSVRAQQPGSLDDELRIQFEERRAAPLVVGLAGEAHGDAAGEPGEDPPVSRKPRRTEVVSYVPDGSANRQDGTGAATPDQPPRVTRGVRPADRAAAAGSPDANPQQGTAGRAVTRTRPPSTTEVSDEAPVQTDILAQPRIRGLNLGPIGGSGRPTASMSEPAPEVPDVISDEEAGRASKLPSRVPEGADGELPEQLPEDMESDDDDIFDDDDSDDDPFVSPMMKISSASTIRMMGSAIAFHPQEIGLIGAPTGGAIGLTGEIVFPQMPLAFGESVAFKLTGPVSGVFDPGSGSVTLDVPLVTIDSDGHAVVLPQFQLTTGTTYDRNVEGIVVSITGAPRSPATGVVKLVGMRQIPVGHGHSSERHLVVMEVLATMDFGTSIDGRGRP